MTVSKPRPWPHRRRLARWGLAGLSVFLAAAHVGFWYWPRERAASPGRGGLPAQLLASGSWDVCLWLPYPHQNVAALQDAVGDRGRWLAAASRVAAVPPPALPSFGPFTLPPSRELAACSNLDGERVAVAARVYPALGTVARLAGRLAGNPWLAGGTVEDGERTLAVAWEGSTWTVTGGEPRPPSPAAGGNGQAEGEAAEPLLAALRLHEGISRFPPGTYHLRRSQGDLELILAGADTPFLDPALARLGREDRPLLLAATESAGGDDRRAPAALALYEGTSVARFHLPGLALFEPAGSPARGGWSLPGGRLLRSLGGGLPAGEAAGWRIVALDRASLARAERLAPRLAAVVDPQHPSARPRLGVGVWAEPRGALRLVARVRAGLDRVPLVRRAEVQRWRDWETILAPLAGCEELSVVSTDWPGSFRLRLARCR